MLCEAEHVQNGTGIPRGGMATHARMQPDGEAKAVETTTTPAFEATEDQLTDSSVEDEEQHKPTKV